MADIIAAQFRIILFETHAQSCAKLDTELDLIVDPAAAKAAIAKVKIPKGALRLVPVSQSVHCVKKFPSGVLDLGLMCTIDGCKYFAYAGVSHKKVDNRASSTDVAEARKSYEFFAPFWCVQSHTWQK